MMFFRYFIVALCNISFLTIRSPDNKKVVSGISPLILTDKADKKDTLFSFEKTNGVPGRKKGYFFKEDGNSKKQYLCLDPSENNKVSMHESSHYAFISQIKGKYMISDSANNCLTINGDEITSKKCKRTNPNQLLNITFYKQRPGNSDESEDSKVSETISAQEHEEEDVHVDRKKNLKRRRSSTEFVDNIDVYVNQAPKKRAEKHSKLRKEEKRGENEFVWVEKPKDMVTPTEDEKFRVIKPTKINPKQHTSVVIKPTTIREKQIADVIETTISTTISTVTTETVKKIEVVTEYLPVEKTTTVQVPVEQILPPIYVPETGFVSQKDNLVHPNVQVTRPPPSDIPSRQRRLKQAESVVKSTQPHRRTGKYKQKAKMGRDKMSRPLRRSKKHTIKRKNSVPKEDSSSDSFSDDSSGEDLSKNENSSSGESNSSEVSFKKRNKHRKEKIKQSFMAGLSESDVMEKIPKIKKTKQKKDRSFKKISNLEFHNEAGSDSQSIERKDKSLKKISNLEFHNEKGLDSQSTENKTRGKRTIEGSGFSQNKSSTSIFDRIFESSLNQGSSVLKVFGLNDLQDELKGTEIEQLIGFDNTPSKRLEHHRRNDKIPDKQFRTKPQGNVKPRAMPKQNVLSQPVIQKQQVVGYQQVPVQKVLVPIVKTVVQKAVPVQTHNVAISRPVNTNQAVSNPQYNVPQDNLPHVHTPKKEAPKSTGKPPLDTVEEKFMSSNSATALSEEEQPIISFSNLTF